MKTLIPIFFLILTVGCASPYYPVYVNSEGDYYIAERVSNAAYQDAGFLVFLDPGFYPWWAIGYPPWYFPYYSSHVCPQSPHWNHPRHWHGDESGIVRVPAFPPGSPVGPLAGSPGLMGSIYRADSRSLMNNGGVTSSTVQPSSVYRRARASSSFSASDRVSGRSAGIDRSSGRRVAATRSSRGPKAPPAMNKQ